MVRIHGDSISRRVTTPYIKNVLCHDSKMMARGNGLRERCSAVFRGNIMRFMIATSRNVEVWFSLRPRKKKPFNVSISRFHSIPSNPSASWEARNFRNYIALLFAFRSTSRDCTSAPDYSFDLLFAADCIELEESQAA